MQERPGVHDGGRHRGVRLAAIVGVLFLAGGLLAGVLAKSWWDEGTRLRGLGRERAAKSCGGASPITRRDVADLALYNARNAELLQTLPKPLGATLTAVDHRSYTRCPEGHGDVVGVVSTGRFRLPATVDRCDVVRAVENGLETEGWNLRAFETTDPTTGQVLRYTDLWHGSAHVALSIGGDSTEYTVFVDHASPHAYTKSPAPARPCP